MRLASIHISNYRCYPKFELEFGGPEIAAVLLVGHMGSGKTTLLSAVYWCLYGEELTVEGSDRSLPPIHSGTADSPLQQGRSEVSVELWFEMQDGARIRVKRKQQFDVRADRQVRPSADSELSVFRALPDSKFERMEGEQDSWVKSHLPKHIAPYYMLNLELTRKFIHDTAENKVRTAIEQNAQLDHWLRLMRRLDDVRREWMTGGTGRGNSTLEKAQAECREESDAVEALAAEITREEREVDGLATEIANLQSQIESATEAEGTGRRLREKRLERADLIDQRARVSRALNGSTAASAPAVFAEGAVAHALSVIDREVAADRWPPGITPQYIQMIQTRGSCVCSRPLNPGSPEWHELDSLVARHEEAPALAKFLGPHERQAAVLLERATGFEKGASSSMASLASLDERLDSVDGEVTHLNRELESLGGERTNLDQWRGAYDAAVRTRANVKEKIAAQAIELKFKRAELEKHEKLLLRQIALDDQRSRTSALVEFAAVCRENATGVYESLMDEARRRVSSALGAAFSKMLVFKSETFRGAEIDDTYRVSVKNMQGMEAAGSLSDGENVCLAMAFGQALGDVSGYEVPPLVLDSPLVKIDEKSKTAVTRAIAEQLGDRQLILLMKQGEFTDSVIESLEVALGGPERVLQHRLVFDESKQATSLIGAENE